VILITEIAVGIVAFVNRDSWNTAVNGSISELFNRYYEDDAIKNDINNLQSAVSHTEEIQVDYYFCN
jgi:hypothetical protein